MTILNKILTWAQDDLKLWQSDAIRRHFQNGNLSTSDIADIYALLKAEHSIPDTEGRKPKPLDKHHLPATSSGSFAKILSIKNLKYVNCIDETQALPFSPNGLTIIYGGNGSGKSGYARVLKHACRARDQEDILPDAREDKSKHGTPEAIFTIEDKKGNHIVVWKHDEPSPDVLASVSVFDSHCARIYIDQEQDVAFIPYGLDVVERFAQETLPLVKQLLDAELECIKIDYSNFDDLTGPTEVGKMIAELPKGCDESKIIGLATISEAEEKRLEKLVKILAASDPKEKARLLNMSSQRMTTLVERIKGAIKLVDDETVSALSKIDDEAESALKAQQIAAGNFQAEEELLPGTGEQTWKTLFESARKFSTQTAYLGEQFPYTEKDAKCPLCQETLTCEAAERLKRFND